MNKSGETFMRKTRKKGFTLTELIVVLVIMSVIVAIAVPFFTNYWKNAEFRKNEQNAKTIYLAAESKLTYYRSSGQWESFKKQIQKQAESDQKKSVQDRQAEKAVFPSDAENAEQLNGRIYTLRLDKVAAGSDDKENLLLQLLDDYIYDKEMLDASMAVEIDLESGEVYSAFYDTKCKGLTYEAEDKDGYLTMQKREYDSRKKRLLGYYSTEDTVNVVALKPTKLRITTISLQNSEKLSLNWSSNVGDSLDTSYEIAVYNKKDNSKLFSMILSPYDLRKAGWAGKNADSASSFASVTLLDSKDKEKGQWSFPLTYKDNKYTLVLDAMMSAKVQALLESREGSQDSDALQRTLSTSICRLASVNGTNLTDTQDLTKPQDIYATVKATSYAGTDSSNSVTKEYRASEAVTSNDANTLYADKTSGNKVEIAAFRHLSNMRYYDADVEATFELTNKNMDWTSVGTGVYDLTTDEQTTTGNAVEKLAWQENSTDKTVDFPTIAEFSENYTLKGRGNSTCVSNLHLGEDSVVDDETVQQLKNATGNENVSKAEYLGVFGELKGSVKGLTLRNPELSFNPKNATGEQRTYSALTGVGILAGRSEGSISDTAITSVNSTAAGTAPEKAVSVSLVSTDNNRKTAAVGGVVGILAGTEVQGDGSTRFTALSEGAMENVSMEGTIEAELPDVTLKTDGSDVSDQAMGYAGGIGGIAGYAKLDSTSTKAVIASCKNDGKISGNYFTGGIVGKLDGTKSSYNKENWKNEANITNCENHGLILCSYESSVQDTSLRGRYFGGITGYSYRSLVYASSSTSGRTAGFTYDESKRNLLNGQYVGGVLGYGKESMLANCSTGSNGYILGGDYVGGIAGGLDGKDTIQSSTEENGISVTTNGSYVIGKNYVGGIVGYNAKNVQLSNCVNNGVVAGTGSSKSESGRYVGGIVGYNAYGASIYDCASYLSDFGNKIFDMIVDTWDARSDYVGGIAGYNNGSIIFTKDSKAITVKSVSSIVVGNNYVGGIAGFNDVNGSLDVNYTLIGGQVYAYESCAGGAFGFNASTRIANQGLTIKPTSVYGKYYVGGCIGANVVNISHDTQFTQLRADNILGSITGEAFCGGIIGYQRTYGENQLQIDSVDQGIRQAVETAQKSADSSGHLLPGLDQATGVPTAVLATENVYTVTIATSENTDKSWSVDTNNIPIKAVNYAGGILGYCEKNSKTVIKNCKNSGNISLASDLLKKNSDGAVTLGDFADSREVTLHNLSDEARNLRLHYIGGITGVNLKNEEIDHCTNTGSLTGFTGIGGVVGLNAGRVYRCELKEHFGNASLTYVGGIAGLNAGRVEQCVTAAGKIISGSHYLGGIVGWNLYDGILENNQNQASVIASGKDASGMAGVGGMAGRNSGTIQVTADNSQTMRTISGNNGAGVGGIIGINEKGGTVRPQGTSGEIVAVGSGMSVTGYEKVGGIVGINHGNFGTAVQTVELTGQARKVQASHGIVGGIAGVTDGDIYHAVNRSGSVTADAGTAGGIVAENAEGKTIASCKNAGNVSSSSGHAGGITAENAGTIVNCTVYGTSVKDQCTIYSLNATESGAICAVNSGIVTNSAPGENVVLQGNATVFGGIAGSNTGNVQQVSKLSYMPQIDSTQDALTVGGAVGENTGTVSDITAMGLVFSNFSGYQYLGGIAGRNGISGNQMLTDGSYQTKVVNCTYSGAMTEKANTSQAGNCYGGIVGINYAQLQNDKVQKITLSVQGVYTATSTSTSEQKETMATHAGGIAGKNESDAKISSCTLEDNADSSLEAKYGMLGGVTGSNKGTIELSGSAVTESVMTTKAQSDVNELVNNAQASDKGKLGADNKVVGWNYEQGFQLENAVYKGTNTKISSNRLNLKMTGNGNVGGITAFNETEGSITNCVSGNWFLLNRSEAIGVGTGGVIGMNESVKDLTGLVNGAFVGRQVSGKNIYGSADQQGQTDRFAGGIIGNQNTSEGNQWHIRNCINYGTVYCYRTHYSGGIIGQWTASGGTIENCRNYGNLQTTYECSWKGASGGIVAQLYHAYEDNDYNIVSCENHGNIYTRDGASVTNGSCGANDSAGILGNVTTYRVDSANKAQNFTIRILDCVNAPGVEIYSRSMASGIFGFLSCDNADVDPIQVSTCNVKIDIERCRNFANILKGKQWDSNGPGYVGGILGARYSETGWSNTTVKDCYSADLGDNEYNYSGYPMYSSGNAIRNMTSGPWNMAGENRSNDFYFDGRNQYGFYGNAFSIGRVDESGNVTAQSKNNNSRNSAYAVTRRSSEKYYDYMDNVHALQVNNADGTQNYAFAELYKSCKVIYPDRTYVDAHGYIIDCNGNSDTRIGQILFYADNETYANHDNVYYKCTMNTDLTHNAIYNNSRESYRRLEGIETATAADGQTTSQILAPAFATATVSDGKISISVTPQNLPNGNSGELCDPFAYVVTVTDSAKQTAQQILYAEEGSFAIPAGMSGNLEISVQAKSMFDDVAESEAVKADVVQSGSILPGPQVQAELVSVKENNKDVYRYKFSLENLEAYSSYSGWQVQIYLNAYKDQKVTLNADTTEAILNVDLSSKDTGSGSNIYQIIAQATAAGATHYEDSPIVSTPAYMPYYRAYLGLQKTGGEQNVATPQISITGNTLDTLSVQISLDNSSASDILSTTPIYRAELIGDWTDGNGTVQKTDVVFAKTDIMTVSKGVATANFTNLPDYLRNAKNLRVRLWYAQTGLGPVYLYHSVSNESEGNVTELVNVEHGVEEWAYTYSLPISKANDYKAYTYTSDTLFDDWLPAPSLDQKDQSSLTPQYDSNNRMQYRFSWDTNVSGTENAVYQISLTGIDTNGREVTIDTDSYTGGRSFTVDAEDWNYQQVRLSVTRVGDHTKKEIGLTSTATYKVAQRLEQPGAPSVINMDVNELNYQISWPKISDETYCKDYQVYIRSYDANGDLQTAQKAGTAQAANGSSVYTQTVNLENYAGSRIVVYVVAETRDASVYVNSAAGVTCEVQIPKRLSKPNVSWTVNWKYNKDQPTNAAEFLSGGLSVSLKTNDASSIPPGGSAYLLKAYVYDSQEAASKALDASPGSYLTAYPVGDVPVQMSVTNAESYYHVFQNLSIQYAGKWIVFYTRISSGAGNISSQWVRSSVAYQLPYVRLAQPVVASDSKTYTDAVTVQTTPNVQGTVQKWTAVHTVLSWNSVDCADLYSIDLAGQMTDGTAGVRQLSSNLRILENTDASGNKTAQVQQYVYRKIQEKTDTTEEKWDYIWEVIEENTVTYPEGTPETEKVHSWDISSYSVPVSANYKTDRGATYYYTLTLTAQLEAQLQTDGTIHYVLKLPDVEKMTAADGSNVTNADYAVTQKATFHANVQKNLTTPVSDAYAVSEPYEINWNN